MGSKSDLTVGWQDGILVEEIPEGRVRYRAEIDGILSFVDNVFRVEPHLLIDRLVGHGQKLDTDYPVTVKGDVSGKVKLSTSSSLEVYGCIDGGAMVRVGNDLKVHQGVVGESTHVMVGGASDLCYVVSAKIVGKGDIVVKRNVDMARMYSDERILVLGEQLKNQNRGAVSGGMINGLKEVQVHSAGSSMNRTVIAVGVDIVLEERLDRLRNLRLQNIKGVRKVQEKLNVSSLMSLTSEKIKRLSDTFGVQTIREQLQILKSRCLNLSSIDLVMKETSLKAKSRRCEGSQIVVHHYLCPDVWVRVLQHRLALKRPIVNGVTLKFVQGFLSRTETGING
jgi:hypothetical protein